MGIVTGLFRMVAPAIVDNLEAQGVIKSGNGLFDTRATPSLIPEMFIGKSGAANLEQDGVIPAGEATKMLDEAAADWLKLAPEEWDTKWAEAGFAYDPVANKAMMEISDKNVNIKKGIDLDRLPANEKYGFSELISAETLKKAYPEIDEVKIGFMDDPESPRLAAFAPDTNTIFFNREHPNWKQGYDPIKTVVHEVQHYVQGKEKLTTGEGFTALLAQNDNFQAAVAQVNPSSPEVLQDASRFAKEYSGVGFTKDKTLRALRALADNEGVNAYTALKREFKSEEDAQKFIAFGTQFPALKQILDAKELASTEYNKTYGDYLRVAGEVFARQTEQRRGMSGAERLERPAMREIITDPLNKKYGINVDNMTPSTNAGQEQVANPFYQNPFPPTV